MKTTLAILITGLIFLATPMLATAHGGDRHHDGPKQKQYKSWVKKDRHDHQAYRNDRLQDRINKLERKLDRQRHAKKHFKQRAKQQRRELQHNRRHLAKRHYRSQLHSSAVVYGFPNLVFHIDW